MDSIIDKLEERECELADRLAETKFTDPEYRTIAENLKIISENKDRQVKTENDRLNNNEKNDIERQRVEIEEEKVKTERMKIKAGIVQDGMDLLKCGGFAYIAYNGDKVSYAVKNILDLAKGYLRTRRH